MCNIPCDFKNRLVTVNFFQAKNSSEVSWTTLILTKIPQNPVD
jgi:hypothetical protein